MNIILGCEESQEVCIAFRNIGHEAYSCDLQDAGGGHPEWHIKDDLLYVLKHKAFDMGIFFPPCTHLAVSGAKHFKTKREDGRQVDAIRFFLACAKARVKYKALENPVGIMSGDYILRHFPELIKEMQAAGFPKKPTQIINPWQFGDAFQKTTCLWLWNLPKLFHAKSPDLFNETITHVGKGEFVTTPKGARLPKWYSDNKDSKHRSKTFPGIAKAMASQWGQL